MVETQTTVDGANLGHSTPAEHTAPRASILSESKDTPPRATKRSGRGEAILASANETWLTAQELAAMLKTCTKTVTRMVQRGKLPKPAALSARCLRFQLGEVLEYLQKAKL